MSAPAGHRATVAGHTPITVLAVLLPLVTAGALALVRPAQTEAPAAAPAQERPLTRADVACPSSLDGAERLRVTAGGQGRVELRAAQEATGAAQSGPLGGRRVAVSPESVAGIDRLTPTLVTGRDDAAPGLLASRSGGSPLVGTVCSVPTTEQWFSAIGGQFEHSSKFELINPAQSTAVVDLAVRTSEGLITTPGLRGLSIPGGSVRRLDVAEEVPSTSLMSVSVTVSRGRVSVSVADSLSPADGANATQDWIPGQEAPGEESQLLGLAAGNGPRTLVLTNPGSDEVRVQVEVIDERSTFTPTGFEEIRVPPDSVRAVRLGRLAALVRQGALGLQISATGPVVAALRQRPDGDVSHLAASQAVEGVSRALLPQASARLVLGPASAAGRVRVVAGSSQGGELLRTRVPVGPGRAAEVELPADAASVSVTSGGLRIAGVVVLEGSGHAVLPLSQPPARGDVPSLRPAL